MKRAVLDYIVLFLIFPVIVCGIQYTKELYPGWNLISIPLVLENNSINNIFESVNYSYLFSYNSGWSIPTEINNALGYWVKSSNDDTLTVEGLELTNSLINLNNGWNLVGYPSLNEISINESKLRGYTIFTYTNNSWLSYISNRKFNSLKTLKPGYGYWVYAYSTINTTQDTYKFYIKNSSGSNVAWFGNSGNVVLKGVLEEKSTHSATANDEFRFRSNDNDVMIIDTTNGNLYIKGILFENQDTLTPLVESDDFIIRNASNDVVAYVNESGYMFLKGRLYENSNP